MKYTSRITKTRNNAGLLGQIGRINDMLENFGDCGTGITKILVIPNGRGGFNAEWTDGDGDSDGETTINGKDLKKILTSIARKIGSNSGELRDAMVAANSIEGEVTESAFNRHCNEMLVLFNKKPEEDETVDHQPVGPEPDGFTQAINDVLGGIGVNPILPVAGGSDTVEPLKVDNKDSDDAEINLKDDKDGSLSVGEGQVGFEKVGNSLRIVFKDISVTLERKAVLALRDFVEDMDIDDEPGMMDNEEDSDDSDDNDPDDEDDDSDDSEDSEDDGDKDEDDED